jgi:hypothetical protein
LPLIVSRFRGLSEDQRLFSASFPQTFNSRLLLPELPGVTNVRFVMVDWYLPDQRKDKKLTANRENLASAKVVKITNGETFDRDIKRVTIT